MENTGINAAGQCAIHDVSSRFSLLMLTARLLTLELELKEANLQMITYPNEYTDKQIEITNLRTATQPQFFIPCVSVSFFFFKT